jgi:hypothetical protein
MRLQLFVFLFTIHVEQLWGLYKIQKKTQRKEV